MTSVRRHRERGAALAIGLVLLSVLTVLALSASRSARLQDRVSRVVRDADVSLQLAETGLRAAERYIESLPTVPTACDRPPCSVYSAGALPNLAAQSNSWWKDARNGFVSGSHSISSAENKTVEESIRQLRYRYVIEALTFVEDDMTIGDGQESGRYLYRISSFAEVGSQSIVVQETYARRF